MNNCGSNCLSLNHFCCSEIRAQPRTSQSVYWGKITWQLSARAAGCSPELLYFVSLSVLLSVSWAGFSGSRSVSNVRWWILVNFSSRQLYSVWGGSKGGFSTGNLSSCSRGSSEERVGEGVHLYYSGARKYCYRYVWQHIHWYPHFFWGL